MLEFDSRRFVAIVNVHTLIPPVHMNMTYYEVGKLAFDFLPILLSRIKALGGSKVHEVTAHLQSHPPFYLITNDPLELEKVKVAQAIEEFLKVWILTPLHAFSGADNSEPARNIVVHLCLFSYLVLPPGE
jgi:hypothetical protein